MDSLEIKLKVLSETKKLYMLCGGDVIFSQLGVWSFSKDRNVLFGLKNFSASAGDFFKFVIDVTDRYENLYAIPNEKGSQVWNALKWDKKFVNISFTDKESISEKLRSGICIKKFFCINIFFVLKPANRKSLIMKRRVFYKGRLPDILLLDTF